MHRSIRLLQIGDDTLEYAVVGTGAPVLLFHGGHSSCHEEFGYPALLAAGYCVITPSRAGYGRTSQAADLREACRLYRSLLDHLAVEQAHVIAVSAGGPTGIAFCSMYPECVASLTLQCAVTKPWLAPEDGQYRMAKRLFKPETERRTWKLLAAMNNAMPKLTLRMMASSFSSLPYSEIREHLDDQAFELFRRMNNRQRSYAGFSIDLVQTQEDYAAELSAIQAPTFIMHSRFDRSVPLSHPEHANRLIPRSETCILDSWGHLIWIGRHAAEYDNALLAFLSRQEGLPRIQ
ncbi:alpha/beta hydrolase [Cohnella lubricantis]|uniref:Alpha/beta hydrolase n=1 Tax=Cohnella lubricantis TaxID=2163172 RepID=A0A841TH47_9BACL|nr:alpha/beta hydrolase [Cohnella lubricantis]MBB6679716.1 alpha/beta hydrolase [Cohnella lubricantis]MBP2119362.1 pimeloyl-ACP methyl ester carboxylesterase [Cohnella lubricantis]